MLRFREKTTLNVITEFDEKTDNIIDEAEMTFKQGEKVDAEICNEDDGDYCDLLFGNGNMATSVLRDCIEEI